MVRTNWGDRWPVSRIFTCLINEQIHHGAEISLLRDLCRNRASLARGVEKRSHDLTADAAPMVDADDVRRLALVEPDRGR